MGKSCFGRDRDDDKQCVSTVFDMATIFGAYCSRQPHRRGEQSVSILANGWVFHFVYALSATEHPCARMAGIQGSYTLSPVDERLTDDLHRDQWPDDTFDVCPEYFSAISPGALFDCRIHLRMRVGSIAHCQGSRTPEITLVAREQIPCMTQKRRA
jgi:hypothetical protein